MNKASALSNGLQPEDQTINLLKHEIYELKVKVANKDALIAELRQQLSAAQSRIELLEHDAKTGDYETLYAQTVVELSAAQASEGELLKALEKIVEDSKDTRLSSMPHLGRTASKAIYSHKERKDMK